jgi:lipopolysaccharide/colanic/teichoic acid biosynthesis glycosyltransferase
LTAREERLGDSARTTATVAEGLEKEVAAQMGRVSLEAGAEDIARGHEVQTHARIPVQTHARIPLPQRLIDLCALTLLVPLVALPVLVVMLAVFLDSPGSVFFRARRVGYRGRHFKMLKFRTMRTDNAGHAVAGANDSRITPIGGFLRASRLDELPQLWNVLRGEMSLVGPRPELEEFVVLHAEDYREILSVPPGITGPTQLRYAGLEPHLLSLQADPESFYRDRILPDKVKLDLEYARTRSLAVDLAVLGRTLAMPPLLLLRRWTVAEGERRLGWRSVLAGTMAICALPLLFLLTLGSPR